MPGAWRILLAQPLDSEAEARLAAGASIVRPTAGDAAEFQRLIADCDALIVRSSTPVSRALIEAGRRLRVIGVAAVGTDNVDPVAAAEHGVVVLHTPAASSDAVAELTLLLLLQNLRPVGRLADEYRAGRFDAARAGAHGVELRTLTVGVVGLGRIGRRVARICRVGFGAKVLYNDIVDVGPLDFDAQPVDKLRLWSESDIITLHVPLTELTRGLVDAGVLARMRPTALLVNTARGAVVHTAALLTALERGTVAGAALDVTDPEPLPVGHPLLSHPRCLLTPHIAARTHGGLRRMMAVVDDVLAQLARA
jgi:phosphoglycerate dehydrogenase-like enzyme